MGNANCSSHPSNTIRYNDRQHLFEGAGGFLIALGFWWHICFPDEIIQRTLLFKSDNEDGLLVLINVVEFMTVIINYCAALHIFRTSKVTEDPHSVLLNIADTTRIVLDTTHVQEIKNRMFLACSFLLLIAD
jgi:hypothetical protein